MRIDRLDLTRFGIFTDEQLDFSSPGIHVVLGRNEAGKTTALRSIDNLLFGFDMRSRYAFLHELKELRIGAVLRDDDGTHEIVRLKRNKDSLRDASDQPIDETIVARLLGGVDRHAYTRLFNINHEDIESGGQALLEDDGELGTALFSASRGTTDLSRVLDDLETRAAGIFKGGGSRPTLNAAISRYKELLATSRSLSTAASAVAKLTQDADAASQRLSTTEQELDDLRRQIALIARIMVVRPLLAERAANRERRDQILAEGPLAGPEVADLLATAVHRRDESAALARNAALEIKSLDDRLRQITVDDAILGEEPAIRALQTDLGGHEQNVTDLPKRRAEAAELQRRLDEQVKELPPKCRPEEGRSITLTVDERSAIRDLTQRAHVLDTQLDSIREQCGKLRQAVEQGRSATPTGDPEHDTVDLHAVIERIRRDGDLQARRDEQQSALDLCTADVQSGRAALGLDETPLDSLDSIPAPSLETIREHRDAMRDRAGETSRIESKIVDATTAAAELRQELEDLLKTEEPPSDADLSLARKHRESGWRLVRGILTGEPPEAELVRHWKKDLTLPEAYEAAVGDADEIADRLRTEAGAVERRAALEQAVAKLDEQRTFLDKELTAATSSVVAGNEAWIDLWAPIGVEPKQPAGMEGWHAQYQACADASRKIRVHRGELTILDRAISRDRADLIATMSPFKSVIAPDSSLSALIDQASAAAKVADDARARSEAAEQKLVEAVDRLKVAEVDETTTMKAQEEWRAEWGRAIAPLGLDPRTRPSAAGEVLEALGELSKTVEQLAVLQSRIGGIVERSSTFRAAVVGVCTAVDGSEPDDESDPAVLAANLDQRLTGAREDSALRLTLLSQRDEKDTVLAATSQDKSASDDQIAALVASTGVADESQLAAAVLRRAIHDEQEAAITALEKTLREQTGLAITAVEQEADQAKDLDPTVELARLQDALPDLEARRKSETTVHFQFTHELEALDGSDEAAAASEAAQHELSEVVGGAEEYVRLTVARHLLEEQIANYRETNQGPLLEKASDLFSRLTTGHYLAIETDVDDKGKAVLLALTAGGSPKEVTALSSGTRDQLYLALRLAALDQLITRQGPLPLILDDLFVHFDDDRTIEGLGVLDSFARQTQVILFTHHQAVVDQALSTISSDRVHVHELMAAE